MTISIVGISLRDVAIARASVESVQACFILDARLGR